MNPIKLNGHADVPPPVVSGNGFSSPIVLENDRAVAPSDGNNRAFPRDPAKYRDAYWELGWTDGRLGQPLEEAEAAVEWRTEVERNAKLADVRAHIAEVNAKITATNEQIGSLPKRITDLREYQHELRMTKFVENPHASIPIGVLYTLVGLLLFIADLPLSLKLVTQALEIPREVDGVSVDDLFNTPLSVIFGPTWEAIFLAGGIAFSGMFVKYFVDEVISPQKFGSLPDDKSSPRPEPNPLGRRIVLTIIFLFFLSTTVVLGIFRASAKEAESVYSLESLTFTLLTLMFPVIGGVCFSAGSRRLADGCRRLKKILHYWKIAFSLSWAERKYRPLQKSLVDHQAELGKLQERLQQEQDDAANNASMKLHLNMYKHGYWRGRTLPETLHVDDRLYPQAKRVVEKILARNLRTRLWEDQSES